MLSFHNNYEGNLNFGQVKQFFYSVKHLVCVRVLVLVRQCARKPGMEGGRRRGLAEHVKRTDYTKVRKFVIN